MHFHPKLVLSIPHCGVRHVNAFGVPASSHTRFHEESLPTSDGEHLSGVAGCRAVHQGELRGEVLLHPQLGFVIPATFILRSVELRVKALQFAVSRLRRTECRFALLAAIHLVQACDKCRLPGSAANLAASWESLTRS